MSNSITPEKLKEIALNAALSRYNTIISKLQQTAARGQNSLIIEDVPEVVQLKLIEEGYSVTPFARYKYDFLLRRKKKKLYLIKF
ncbi:hypothetical protein HX017_17600 [Myroides marinus]|uniref:Uncharacterized protein n=1 Tax=Myroides marinus TaxID=703342 RepID=A0A163U642_9FLAO|nr:hypothetical protein [Myroides marinus]KUF42635.1 hypothetical protein AS361_12545 [Myroides marinus]KZE72868.1 hypothetical protein AV926_02345 [Myroides marinus]MDM1347662.1 hypothetical protein [Myroides marinus]MDM1352398.1 hypothetical protein [Myroides marinus]MDM1355792.1 hypothetical protein [Myroides marinus]